MGGAPFASDGLTSRHYDRKFNAESDSNSRRSLHYERE